MIATTDDQMAERMKEFKKELREKTIQKDKNLDRG
jgi:phosphoribosylcarboxyaminoimidazole (NCAIR) mutase